MTAVSFISGTPPLLADRSSLSSLISHFDKEAFHGSVSKGGQLNRLLKRLTYRRMIFESELGGSVKFTVGTHTNKACANLIFK